jgi:hypothetical protein
VFAGELARIAEAAAEAGEEAAAEAGEEEEEEDLEVEGETGKKERREEGIAHVNKGKVRSYLLF